MPRTFGSLSAYEPGLMDQARWWLQDKLTPVMGGDARRAGDFVQNKVMPTAEYLPGVGDAMAAGEAVDYFRQGQPIFGTLLAAGAAAGLVPGVGDAVQKGIKAAVKSRGDEVLGLLKAGRAEEVTDDMLDMGNAADNANLNAYLFENYDLPMDEASRMGRAQEMGFDDNVYHGSKEPDLQTMQRGRGYGGGSVGVWTTDNPTVASEYIGPEGQLYGLKTRGSHVDVTDYSGTPALQKIWDDGFSEDWMDEFGYQAAESGVEPSEAFIDRVLQGDIWQTGDNNLSFQNDVIDWLSNDYERVSVGDSVASISNTSKVIRDPENIRSRFARFDPRLKHLRNLSAGLAPFGALSIFNAYQDDNYQPPQL